MPLRAPQFPFATRLVTRLDEWLAAPAAALAVEFAPRRLVVARQGDSGLRARIKHLEIGQVAASAVQPNLAAPDSLAAQLRVLIEALGGLGEDAVLLVPDLTARLSVLDFDVLPARRDELDPLVRFRLRKSLPFAEEQAVISCQVLPDDPRAPAGTPKRLLVAIAERARLDEYENCLQLAGGRAATVLPSGLACLAAHPALDHGTLLVRAEPGCLTTAFCLRGRVEFFRAIEIEAEAHFDDVFPSIAFFRDRWEQQNGAGADDQLLLYTAGIGPELDARLREEIPWAAVRPADIRATQGTGLTPTAAGSEINSEPEALLAVAGALQGRFS